MSALENEADTQVPKARVDAGTVDNCLGCARLSCLRLLSHLHSPSDDYDEPETRNSFL